jgi:hypothetical protein
VFDLAGLLQPAIDRLLANHGLTRGDVFRFKQDAEALLVEIKEAIPNWKARFESMEKALHTQTEALTILLDEKNKRDELERLLKRTNLDISEGDINARSATLMNGVHHD